MEWNIIFKKRHAREEKYVIMPTVEKLLDWIARNAADCRECRIFLD